MKIEPSRSIQIRRMFFCFSSIFSAAAASGHSIGRSLSAWKTVVTMKKMRSKNAMSASDDDGTSDDAFDFLSNPPFMPIG